MTLNEIEQAIQSNISTVHLEVLNESHMHSVPEGSLTHIKVIIVSEDFKEMSLVKRHRIVYAGLAHLMQQGLHAVSVHAYTPEEWRDRNTQAPVSPPCKGGRNKEIN